MQKKHHIVLYSVLCVALAAAVLTALSFRADAERASRALEDDYSRRVTEAQEHLQAIGIKLGKAQAAGGAETLTELLSGISRRADGAVAELSSLPLSHIAMSDTIKFCNQLGDYASSLLPIDTLPLSTDDETRLGEFENGCALLIGQLATARERMLSESLLMATAESVYFSDAQNAARPLEQVGDGDNGMEYPSMIYDGPFSDARRSGTPKALGDKRVNESEALEIARDFIGGERIKAAQIGAGMGGALESHGVTLTLNDGTMLNAEVTKQGGKLIWIMPEHAEFEMRLGVDECKARALDFLKSRGYGDMEANHFQVYDGLAVINLVPLQEGVPLYPDLVKLQIRMDTGEAVGLEANNYLMNHEKRASLIPSLSEAQALERVSPRLNAGSARLCVIPYDDGELLCYEARGEYDGSEYRVYIDALTGDEREVLIMVDSADGEMSA